MRQAEKVGDECWWINSFTHFVKTFAGNTIGASLVWAKPFNLISAQITLSCFVFHWSMNKNHLTLHTDGISKQRIITSKNKQKSREISYFLTTWRLFPALKHLQSRKTRPLYLHLAIDCKRTGRYMALQVAQVSWARFIHTCRRPAQSQFSLSLVTRTRFFNVFKKGRHVHRRSGRRVGLNYAR